jgi:hypothetical protein
MRYFVLYWFGEKNPHPDLPPREVFILASNSLRYSSLVHVAYYPYAQNYILRIICVCLISFHICTVLSAC